MSDEEQFEDEEQEQEEEESPGMLTDQEAEKLQDELTEAGAEEQEQEEVEEEERAPDLPLTEEMVAENLSLLSRIGDGLAHAYIKLDVREKELTDISILNRFIHLRFIDMSRNHLKDISALSAVSHLLTLRIDNNELTSAKLEELPYLQFVSLSRNKIKSLEGLSHPMLQHLCLNFNDISMATGLDPNRMTHLHTLELRGNKLQSTKGIQLPCLKQLFVGGNMLQSLEDIDCLVSLKTLHMRDNQLTSLDGFSENMKSLEYINMRGNNVSQVEELKKLAVLSGLKSLVVSENAASEDDEYRLEVIADISHLIRLDKDDVTQEERQEATELRKTKLAEQQAKRVEDEAMEQSQSQEDAPPPPEE